MRHASHVQILADKLKSKHDLIDITPGIGLDSDTEATVAKRSRIFPYEIGSIVPVSSWSRASYTLVSHRFAVIQSRRQHAGSENPTHRSHQRRDVLFGGRWRFPRRVLLNGNRGAGEVHARGTSALHHDVDRLGPLPQAAVLRRSPSRTLWPHAALVQPVLSGAHFFTSIAFLPYKMGINPPHECQYALGYYRPGNCAPWLVPPVPLSLRGAAVQAGAVAGVSAIIP